MIFYDYDNRVSLGPARTDGKQSITVTDTKDNVRKTFLLDKTAVDEYMNYSKKAKKAGAWGTLSGFATGAMIILSACAEKAAKTGFNVAAIVTGAACILSLLSARSAEKEGLQLLKNAEKTEAAKA